MVERAMRMGGGRGLMRPEAEVLPSILCDASRRIGKMGRKLTEAVIVKVSTIRHATRSIS